MPHRSWFQALAVAALVSGAAGSAHAADQAHATMMNADGESVGAVTLTQTPSGVLIQAELARLPAGWHAFHIHETGKCEPPFKSAGGHFAPAGHAHGIRSEDGMHAGDLPNVFVPESGELKFDASAKQVTLAEGEANSLFDDDGSAIMMHSGADDYQTDPAGDAGDRIACGVIESGS